ncbi:unnamed protein product [Amoebophrya sp. A25]|nr:unnamed protein product [Amoebophrya sp. A25]|eukprot:GSA25T00027222001.1
MTAITETSSTRVEAATSSTKLSEEGKRKRTKGVRKTEARREEVTALLASLPIPELVRCSTGATTTSMLSSSSGDASSSTSATLIFQKSGQETLQASDAPTSIRNTPSTTLELESLFCPVVGEESELINWSSIPACLRGDGSLAEIMSAEHIQGEAARARKWEKKMLRKLADGEVTEAGIAVKRLAKQKGTRSTGDDVRVVVSSKSLLVGIPSGGGGEASRSTNSSSSNSSSTMSTTSTPVKKSLSTTGEQDSDANVTPLTPSALASTTSLSPATTSRAQNFSVLNAERDLRKRQQIENFYVLLRDWKASSSTSTKDNIHTRRTPLYKPIFDIVDFGCGSGNLCLPLAFLFPQLRFLLVDRNPSCLDLARKRAEAAGLKNVEFMRYSWDGLESARVGFLDAVRETFSASGAAVENGDPTGDHKGDRRPAPFLFALGLGLHCCGDFSDLVLETCIAANADCILCPCCNGKMGLHKLPGEKILANEDRTNCMEKNNIKNISPNISHPDPNKIFYPRSPLLQQYVAHEQYVSLLCPAADDLSSHDVAPTQSRKLDFSQTLGRNPKCLIEIDRAAYARTHYYHVDLMRLAPASCTPKNLVIRMIGCKSRKKDHVE